MYASEVIKREREGMNVYSIERKKNEIVPGIERKRERLRVYASEREREREKERERKRERERERERLRARATSFILYIWGGFGQ